MIAYKIQIVQTWHDRDKDRRIAVAVDWRISWNKTLIFLTTCGLELRSILTWGVQVLRSPNFFLGEWKQIET